MAKRTRASKSDFAADKQGGNAVQRANVRRAQQSGRQRAKAQAERTAASTPSARKRTSERTSERSGGRTKKASPQSNSSSTHGASSTPPNTPLPVSTATRRSFVWVLILLVAGLIGLAAARNGRNWWAALQVGAAPIHAESATATAPAAAAINNPEATPTAANEGEAVHIGIISGHRGNDSGSVCSDGLTEASINFNTATRVAGLLRSEGYRVDILDEFDARLNGYKADVLLSIHSDSCTYINDQASGYKIARFLYSDIPAVEDKLVACVSSRYKKATGLRFHANTVTHNMTEYHALRKIDPKTPGAIIELGFMYLDRTILTKRQDDMARGIADGLDCFLKEEKP